MNEQSKIYQLTRQFMKGIPSQTVNDDVQDDLPDEVKVLRARLNIEEVFEKLEQGFGVDMYVMANGDRVDLDRQSIEFEVVGRYDPVELLDGAVDTSVINAGDLISAGLSDLRAHKIVGDNNLLKLETGTVREDGKLVKHPDHPKPDLEDEVSRQRQRGINRFLTSRQQFELWAQGRGHDCDHYDEGDYCDKETDTAWQAWQAARA